MRGVVGGMRVSRCRSCPLRRGTLAVRVLAQSLVQAVILMMTGGVSAVRGGATVTRVWESRFLMYHLLKCVTERVSSPLSLKTLTIVLQGGTAHRAPGLGRQNRKQRLGEYAAERGAVLGFVASAAASGAVGGRTKRARGVGVGGSGARDSDETDEDTDSEDIEDEEEDMDVDALAARVTIVFEGGRSGAIPGYVLSPPRSSSLPPCTSTDDIFLP
jgi:hypothetical protein